MLVKRPVFQKRVFWSGGVFVTVVRIMNQKRKCLPFSRRLVMKCLHVTLRHAAILIKDNDRLNVKFWRRKDCKQIMSVKKELKHCSIFINANLCPYYRMFQSKCKRLHNLSNISNFYIFSGTIKIKTTENRNPISITHFQDFIKHFLEVDLLPTT